jgi:ribonuclease R
MARHKNSRKKGKRLSTGQLKHEIAKLFKRSPRKRLNSKQIIQKLKITNNRDSVQEALNKLTEENKLVAVGDYKYRVNTKGVASATASVHHGIVDMTRTGAAYVICDDLEDDVYVPAKHVNSALSGDKVEISVFTAYGRRRPEGEIVKVLERSTEYFIGTLRLSRKYGIVIPDKINMPVDIYVELEDTKDAKEGEKVVVKIVRWPTRKNFSPIGKVTSVLGEAGTHDIEMKAILINNGFNLEFPEAVMEESEALATEIGQEEVARRKDMREVTTFTIDPDTAKDFDDALSIRYLEDGSCEVGVHIADVTHYVKADTALDKEAYNRSTSVYLVDRVLPMLPEKLSNELCSLRPNEDKCTFSAVFVFDKNDKITDRWFGKTLTHSNRRFAYEEAQEILENGAGEFADELKKLNQLAKVLRKRKFKNGAIAFESDEVKFQLDENGAPIGVFTKERKEAHMLIEDFMLLANREVAIYIAKKGQGHEIPFVYRVHDLPNADKVADLALFAKELGFQIKMDTPRQIADSYNELAKAARQDEALRMLEPIAIRTMAKAEYTPDNIGHYGLAFEYYTHFTSPIRRYSDVLSHRILEQNLNEINRFKKDVLEEQCKHISAQERKAMTAERESVKYKQVEYIEKHIGEEFTGYISGIIDRGFFVELNESKCEGLVGYDTLDDAYEVDNSRLKVTGIRTKKVYKMGDKVTVRIVSTNISKRQIEMEIVD